MEVKDIQSMKVNEILEAIASTQGTNAKMALLETHKDNELLVKVIYAACSKRVKYYIKQIPEFKNSKGAMPLSFALEQLTLLSDRVHRGHAASNHLAAILSEVSEDDAEVIVKIIQKDLKIGLGTSLINKVIVGLIEKTPYMGAKSFSEKLAKNIFKGGRKGVSQVKMDGRYMNAIIRGGEVETESRSGETTHVGNAKFLEELGQFDDCVLNGELTIHGVTDRYTANGMVASIVDIEGKREERGVEGTNKKIKGFEKKHGSYTQALANIEYTVWDIITVDEYFAKKSNTPYNVRLENLMNVLVEKANTRVELVETKVVESYEDAMVHFQDSLARELEGTILKAEDCIWKNGKPNEQVKMKLEMTIDLKIVGFEYGTSGTKNENVISRLLTETNDGIVKSKASGMTEDMMQFITDNQEALLGTIVEVRSCGMSQDRDGNKSLLHPSVVKLRDDKDTCDSYESAMEIENMAKSLV